MGKVGIVLAGMLMIVGSVAVASEATLDSMTGSVLVDSGNDFQETSIGAELNKGDRIMAMEDAKAVIRYASGCTETIKGAQIVIIDQPCKAVIVAGALAGTNAVAVGAFGGLLAVGALATDGGNGGANPPPASP